ncbi:MAG: hypothetical protein FD129_1500, partial [bacterium]
MQGNTGHRPPGIGSASGQKVSAGRRIDAVEAHFRRAEPAVGRLHRATLGMPSGAELRRSIEIGRIDQPRHRFAPWVSCERLIEIDQRRRRHQRRAPRGEMTGMLLHRRIIRRHPAQVPVVAPFGAVEPVAERFVGHRLLHGPRRQIERVAGGVHHRVEAHSHALRVGRVSQLPDGGHAEFTGPRNQGPQLVRPQLVLEESDVDALLVEFLEVATMPRQVAGLVADAFQLMHRRGRRRVAEEHLELLVQGNTGHRPPG